MQITHISIALLCPCENSLCLQNVISNVVLRVFPRIINLFTLILRPCLRNVSGFVPLLLQNFPQESLDTRTGLTVKSLLKIGELESLVLPFNYNTS